jgi:hypothetical protein
MNRPTDRPTCRPAVRCATLCTDLRATFHCHNLLCLLDISWITDDVTPTLLLHTYVKAVRCKFRESGLINHKIRFDHKQHRIYLTRFKASTPALLCKIYELFNFVTVIVVITHRRTECHSYKHDEWKIIEDFNACSGISGTKTQGHIWNS